MRNIFFLLFLLPAIAYAQPVMSLDECIRLAWKQNSSIRNSAIGMKEARTDYVASIGTFLPRIV
ncbi:MAG: TolC family protein, partial [Bacteroides acidifaciens]|nr:TolC family protein [Bacteroides acidifaciens]